MTETNVSKSFIADMILAELAKTNNLTENVRNIVRSAILMRHVHPHLKRRRSVGGEQGRRRSSLPRNLSNGRDINDDTHETSPLVKASFTQLQLHSFKTSTIRHLYRRGLVQLSSSLCHI